MIQASSLPALVRELSSAEVKKLISLCLSRINSEARPDSYHRRLARMALGETIVFENMTDAADLSYQYKRKARELMTQPAKTHAKWRARKSPEGLRVTRIA